MEVKTAGIGDIEKLIPTLHELRPHHSPEELAKMLRTQMEEGFQVIYVGDDTLAYAVGGFRTLHMLFSGKTLYLDDLVTHPDHRKKGYAGMLLKWLIQYAKDNEYDHFSLDSGVHRKDAHRLYLNYKLEINAFHFGRNVDEL